MLEKYWLIKQVKNPPKNTIPAKNCFHCPKNNY